VAKHTLISCLLGVVLLWSSTLWAPAARALEPHERQDWYLGLGFGPVRGAIEADDEGTEVWLWDWGASPQIRFGKNLGRRFALGMEVQTWFTEAGTAGDDLPIQLKLRFTGNLWALAGTWYPGPVDGFWGGFFVRAGAGPAIANYALAIPDPADSTGGREIQARIDRWGWGAVVAIGYEIQVSKHFAAGVQASSNFLWIDADIRRMWYGGPVLQLLWYF
jgi:hypothetical protein